MRRKSGCKGRLKINEDEFKCEPVKVHNHIADFGEVKAAQLVGAMKSKAAQEVNLSPLHLTRDVMTNADFLSKSRKCLSKSRTFWCASVCVKL